MADTTTPNYGLTKPEPLASVDTWAPKLNADLDIIDTTMKANATAATAALPKAGGTLTGPLLLAAGSLAAPAIGFSADPDAGRYSISSNKYADVANSVTLMTYDSVAGVTANLTLSVTGAFTANGVANFAAKATHAASVAGAAGLNVPHGVAPTVPVNGDIWTTTTGVFARINGGTLTLASTTTTGLLAANNLSDVASVATARTNLGVTATGADAAYCLKANNLSDVVAATARNNLGLGSLALLSVPTFTQLVTAGAGIDITTPMAAPTTTEAGYMGMPQVVSAGNRTLVITDRGKMILFSATATATIPANASVAYPIGTIVGLDADVGVTLTITTTDTLRQVPNNALGSRTVVGPGSAFIQKKKSTEWWITGDAV